MIIRYFFLLLVVLLANTNAAFVQDGIVVASKRRVSLPTTSSSSASLNIKLQPYVCETSRHLQFRSIPPRHPFSSSTTTTTTERKATGTTTSSPDVADISIASTNTLSLRNPKLVENFLNLLIQSFHPVTTKAQPMLKTKSTFYESSTVANSWIATLETMKQSIWMWPMLLIMIPIYCAVLKGTWAIMPSWWPLTNIEYIKQSKDAVFVLGFYLFSNIAYLISGIYLLNRFPFEKQQKQRQHEHEVVAGRVSNISLLRLWPSFHEYKPTKYSMLGLSLLASGLISTIFHSVQAMGSFAVANALCYIDHAFALSSGLYYIKILGRPSPKTLTIGLLSLVSLVLTPNPGYAWLHSTWHYLSAVTATRWAIEGYTSSITNSS